MKNILAIVAISLSLTACSLVQPRPVEQQIVYVDRIVRADPPKPNDVTKPTIPVLTLTGKESDDDTLKAYVTSVNLLLGYSQGLEQALQPFRDAYAAAVAAKEKAAPASAQEGKK